jgi:hypothetical protein
MHAYTCTQKLKVQFQMLILVLTKKVIEIFTAVNMSTRYQKRRILLIDRMLLIFNTDQITHNAQYKCGLINYCYGRMSQNLLFLIQFIILNILCVPYIVITGGGV